MAYMKSAGTANAQAIQCKGDKSMTKFGKGKKGAKIGSSRKRG